MGRKCYKSFDSPLTFVGQSGFGRLLPAPGGRRSGSSLGLGYRQLPVAAVLTPVMAR